MRGEINSQANESPGGSRSGRECPEPAGGDSAEAKAYLARQREAGKSHKEGMRCLKRHLSNVVYRHLLMDARRLEQVA